MLTTYAGEESIPQSRKRTASLTTKALHDVKIDMMEEVSSPTHSTYGGEVEILIIDKATGSVAPLPQDIRTAIQQKLEDVLDSSGLPVHIGYDATASLVELRGGIYEKLPHLLYSLQHALFQLWDALEKEGKYSLLASAYHPLEDPRSAYKYVIPRPIYSVVKGSFSGAPHIHREALSKIYPTRPELGRNWRHEETSLAAAIQPWNSLEPAQAADQIAALQATGWIFNLLTANSPFAQGRLTGKRDYRLEIWNTMTAASRYKQDRTLMSNIPIRPRRLVDYYKFVFSNQRPAVIPDLYPSTRGNPAKESKTNVLAIKQPGDRQEFNILTYLQADTIKAIHLDDASEQNVTPSVAHIFNNFDFFYIPRYGARLRINLPDAELLNPKEFALAILNDDEETFQSLLVKGGIRKGSICVEGRVSATTLPTQNSSKWEQFNIPFVLQTAILRSYKKILNLFEETKLTWNDLVERLPTLTNTIEYGFKTTINGSQADELAKNVWEIAKKSLSPEESALVGDTIDRILSTHKAPAEEQIDFFKKEKALSTQSALPHLITHLSIESMPRADVNSNILVAAI
jgi:hypothetical protein